MSAMVVNVLGTGLWAEGLGTWEDACARWRGDGSAGEGATSPTGRPQTSLLPPTERRRAPATVSLALSVAEQACHQAGFEPQSLRSVFSSAHGDLEITDYLCSTLAESPEHLSPTKFHHSVHNAASGYWTIGVGSMQASTAISAGRYSFAQGLLEAATQAVCEQAPVLLVAYDMPAPARLMSITGSTSLVGLALVLAPPALTPAGEDMASTLMTLHLQAVAKPEALEDRKGGAFQGHPVTAALMGRSPMAVGLPLFEALAAVNSQPPGPADCCVWLSSTQALMLALSRKSAGAR